MKEFEIVLDKRLKVVNFIPVSGLSPGDLAAGSEFPKAISPLGKRTGLYLLRWSVGHDQRSFEGPLDLVLNHEEAHYLVKGTKENGHIHLRGKEITSHLDSPIETLKRRASFFEALTRSFADGLHTGNDHGI